VKRLLYSSLCLGIAFGSAVAFGQALPPSGGQGQATTGQVQGVSGQPQQLAGDVIQQMQKADPLAAQAMSNAIQRGDFDSAKRIYEDFKKKQDELRRKPPLTKKQEVAPDEQEPSLIERTLSGDFPKDILFAPLTQFGYDVFLKTAATFGPMISIPVGPDYVIGPGDQLTLTLWGTTEGIYNFEVTREGNITLPKVGVVRVAGLRFGELENTLRRHLSKYYSNFNLSVSMGSLKTITVYVVGEVVTPGSFSLNSLTTVYGALFAAGGPTKKGTMRKVQVLRNGKVVKTIDLYGLLLRGEWSQDARLQHNDTVFVPLIGHVAGVAGSVYRPAIYEFKEGASLGELLQYAGGIMPIAAANRVQITRFSDHTMPVVLDIKLTGPDTPPANDTKGLDEKVRNMDTVSVFPIYDKVWETVNLKGEVRNPGNYQWRPDLRLREVIEQGQLLPTTYLRRAEVIRLTADLMDREVLPVDLEALVKGDDKQNIPLKPRDDIRVYTTFREAERVELAGEVVKPGIYEVQRGEHLSDLLRRAGGFTNEAYPYGTVFNRRDVKNAQARNFQVFITRLQGQVLQVGAQKAATAISAEEVESAKTESTVNKALLENLKALQELSEGRVAINITTNIDEWAGTKEDLLLQAGDRITVPKRPQEVLVVGEVNNAGAQVYVPNLMVKDYVANSGGTTKYADADEIYVVKANGFAVSKEAISGGKIENMELKAGDSVFVPQQVERYATMRVTRDIVDIMFKTAVIIATITVLF
jgi:protein involved in polysaccharide export with SLBB domain